MADPSFRDTILSARTTGDVVFTKPSGLTVGDRMVVFIVAATTPPSASPSGFSLLEESTSGYNVIITVYTKIADAGDTAASNFTWTCATNSGGVMYDIVNAGDVEYSAVAASDTGANLSVGGFDPAVANDLLMTADRVYTTGTSTFATANNNPSWYASNWGSGGSFGRAVYASDAATGTITDTNGGVVHVFGVVAVAPKGAPPAPDLFLDGVWG